MSFHVYECRLCGRLCEGAAWHSTHAPRDRYGRIERDYVGPKFCTEICRDKFDEGYPDSIALVDVQPCR